MNLFRILDMKKFLCGDTESLRRNLEKTRDKNNELVRQAQQVKRRLIEAQSLSEEQADLLDEYRDRVDALQNQSGNKPGAADDYLDHRYREASIPVYEDKRSFQGHKYPIRATELITPDSYMVQRFRQRHTRNSTKQGKEEMQRLYRAILENMRWVSDTTISSTGDKYLYPHETLARRKADCEDFTYLCMSLHPNVFAAWGRHPRGQGHAFPLYYEEGMDEPEVFEPSNQSRYYWKPLSEAKKDGYKVHYYLTRTSWYEVDASVQFGVLAKQL